MATIENPMMLPTDSTLKFSEVFENSTVFLKEWKDSALYDDKMEDKNITKLFYLLYASKGNTAISNMDVNQWKYKVWSIICQYGPTWQRKLEIQKALRSLNEEQMTDGTKAINNLATNPQTEPSTNVTEEINGVVQQTVNKFKKSRLEGYASLVDLLDADVTKEFLDRFKPLFAMFVKTRPAAYVVE